MQISTGIAIYFLIWWIVLFAVLPWGIRSQGEGDAGTMVQGSDPGAPLLPRLGRKLLWTTFVSAVIFGVGATLYVQRIVTFDTLAGFFRMPF
ncbi:MAG: DUF1467 family protein [Pseudorhodoplanes sp.]